MIRIANEELESLLTASAAKHVDAHAAAYFGKHYLRTHFKKVPR